MLRLLVGAVLTAQADDAGIRAIVDRLMIANRPAANAPVFSLPPLRIPGEPEPKIDPNDPRLAAYDAVEKLRALGTQAWPFLIERLADGRQSIALAAEIPCTVGRACFHLIADEVNPRAPRAHFDDYDLLDGDDLPLWWTERKSRDLRELRIEAARFAWTLAEFDGQHVAHYAAVLKKLGIDDPTAEAAPWRALAAGLKTPDEPEALVPLLAAPIGGGFLARRAGRERRGRAWGKLYALESAAFPALARGLEDPALAESCFRIVHGVLHPYGLDSYDDLYLIRTPAEAAAWWRTRKDLSLKELRLEAARHARSTAERRAFASPEDRQSLLDFLDERIRNIERKP